MTIIINGIYGHNNNKLSRYKAFLKKKKKKKRKKKKKKKKRYV
jgi:hypothetical protein